jgi:hypothetical protein
VLGIYRDIKPFSLSSVETLNIKNRIPAIHLPERWDAGRSFTY